MVTESNPAGGLRYRDLQAFPEDNLRRELIGGELIVTAAPSTRHQAAVMVIAARLFQHAERHGGSVFPAPTDVYLSETDIVEPDVVFVLPGNVGRIEDRFIRSAPDVVVEVSSPSTRLLEVRRKRDLYERFGVAEYWYVDLEADRIEVYRLHEGTYGLPHLVGRGDTLISPRIPGFSLAVDEVLGKAPG